MLAFTDDLVQTFASVEEEMRDSEPLPNDDVSFQPQFSAMPVSTSQAEPFAIGAPSNVYAPETVSPVYPPGNVPMHASMMVGHGRDFSQPAANFQMEDPGKLYQTDQATWQSGPENESVYPSVSLPPSSMGIAPQGEMRPEFHPNLEPVAPRDPQEGNLPV